MPEGLVDTFERSVDQRGISIAFKYRQIAAAEELSRSLEARKEKNSGGTRRVRRRFALIKGLLRPDEVLAALD